MIRTDRGLLLFMLLAATMALPSCQSRTFSLYGVDRPVVLGDRLHIGPEKHLAVRPNRSRSFAARTYEYIAAAGGSSSRSVGGGMVETTTTSGRDLAKLDDTNSAADRALGFDEKRAIRRCRIHAYSWVGNFLFVVTRETGFKADGEVVDQVRPRVEPSAKNRQGGTER